jgi:hypothetical protein
LNLEHSILFILNLKFWLINYLTQKVWNTDTSKSRRVAVSDTRMIFLRHVLDSSDTCPMIFILAVSICPCLCRVRCPCRSPYIIAKTHTNFWHFHLQEKININFRGKNIKYFYKVNVVLRSCVIFSHFFLYTIFGEWIL